MNRFKRWRKHHYLSQEAAARMCSVSRRTIVDWETRDDLDLPQNALAFLKYRGWTNGEDDDSPRPGPFIRVRLYQRHRRKRHVHEAPAD